MAEKDKAVSFRDKLNQLAEESLVGGDVESHVVACCIALSIEALEEWLYDDKFYPSVRPYIEGKDWKFPTPKGQRGDEHTGPPWNRKRVKLEDKFPILAKMKQDGSLRDSALDGPSPEEVKEWFQKKTYTIDDWSEWTKRVFRSGQRGRFIRGIQRETGISAKVARVYADDMIEKHSKIYGIDEEPGDECPDCGCKNIRRNGSTHPFTCTDCGTMWGNPWS